MDSLCHPWFTTANVSYRFPIFETSATALCGTTGIRNSLWGVATWMSEVPKLERFNKKAGHPKWSISFYFVFKKSEFFKLTEGYTPRLVLYTHSFNAKRVFACILFCSYPCFSFSFDACLGCHQLSAAETHTWNMDEHHTFVNAMIAWNLAIHGTHGGDPFVNFTL